MCHSPAKYKKRLAREGTLEAEREGLMIMIARLIIMRDRLRTETSQGATLQEIRLTRAAACQVEIIIIVLACLFAFITLLLLILFS